MTDTCSNDMKKQDYFAIIAEPQCVDFEHIKVNGALLMATCLAFPTQRFLFVAESRHLAEVKKITAAGCITNLDFVASPIAGRPLSQVRRVVPDAVFLAGIFWRAFGSRARVVILLSIDSSILMVAKLLATLYPRLPVLGVPHSVLANVAVSKPSRLIDRMFHFRTALEFLCHSRRVHYLILGESIMAELSNLMPALLPVCHVLEHPYSFPTAEVAQIQGEVIFAFIGVAQNHKGFGKFIQLVRDINRSDTEKGQVRFLCAGGNPHYEFKLSELEGIEIPFAGEYVPEEDFQRLCSGITYAVMPYGDSYRFYPSGAVFDAFSHLKPIICLRNPYFQELFNQLGDIGYMCDSYDELLQTVREIILDFPQDRYRAQQLNISKGREQFSPTGIKGRLYDVVSQLGGYTC